MFARKIGKSHEGLVRSGARGGFVPSPTVDPVTLEKFSRMAVPDLQRRGRFSTGYAAATQRGYSLDAG